MNAIKDLFDKKILKYTVLPFIISLIFWLIVFLFFSHNITQLLLSVISYLPFGEKISNLIANIGSVVLIIILYYVLVIATLGVFSSFFIDKIVLRINEKHYNLTPKNPSFYDTLKGVFVSVKSFFIYILIFVFTFYFLFIPVVNIIYQMFMMSVLNKKLLIFDGSYLFCDTKEIEKKYNFQLWWRVFFTSFIYLIPFISLFGYTFQLIIIVHFILKNCNK